MAVGMLAASGQIVGSLDDAVFIGELSLDGEVRSVHGVLPMVVLARKHGKQREFVPGQTSTVGRLLGRIGVFHLGFHIGEMSALKGVQDLKGIPF